MTAPFKGMICIDHFSADDLLQATKSLPVRLKKGAVPRIFNSIQVIQSTVSESGESRDVRDVENVTENIENASHEDETDKADESLIKCTNKRCEFMLIEYESLKKEYFLQETSHHCRISKMDMEIKRLKSLISNQTNSINRLNHQVARDKKSKNALSVLLQDLKQKSILSEEAANAPQVHIFLDNF